MSDRPVLLQATIVCFAPQQFLFLSVTVSHLWLFLFNIKYDCWTVNKIHGLIFNFFSVL